MPFSQDVLLGILVVWRLCSGHCDLLLMHHDFAVTSPDLLVSSDLQQSEKVLDTSG